MIVFRAALSRDAANPQQQYWKDRSNKSSQSLSARKPSIKVAEKD